MIKYKLYDKNNHCISISYENTINEEDLEQQCDFKVKEKIQHAISFYKKSATKAKLLQIYINNELYKEVTLNE